MLDSPMQKDLEKEFFKRPKLPFSYGWIVLIVGTVGVLMGIPGQTMGISVFTDYLMDAMKISRTGISTTYMIGTLVSAVFLGKAGKFYDRFGAKITAFIAVFFLALVLVYLSFIDVIMNIILSLGILTPGIVSFILLSFGFFILRFFGQGVISMVSRNMVVKWFDKNRGLIIALMGASTALGFSLAPKIFSSLIDTYDWRGAWRIMALILFPAFSLIVLVFFKDWKASSTENSQQLERDSVKSKITSRGGISKDKTLHEAIRTQDFWSYNLAIAFFAMFNTAFTFHIVSIFSYAEIDRSAAVAIFIPISIIAVILSFTGNILSDYINLKIILFMEFAGIIVTSAAIIFLSPGLAVIILIAGLGIANGSFVVLISLAWVNTFGKQHLGAISGYSMGWTVAGSAVGPFLFSLLRDLSGDYHLVSLLSIIFVVSLLIFSLYKKGSVKS